MLDEILQKFLDQALFTQGPVQVSARPGVIRLDTQRLLKDRHGFGGPIQPEEGQAQVVECFAFTRLAFERALKTGDRLFEATLLGEQHAELVVGACMARIQAQRLPQARLCLGRLPQRQGGHTQQVPHLAVVGFGVHEPASAPGTS